MNRLPTYLLRTTAAIAVVFAIVACGPTANALRPTLPARSVQPQGGADHPVASGDNGGQYGPPAPGTPPPPGIAQPIVNFPQGPAYEVIDVTATPSGGFVAVGYGGTGQGYYGPHQGVVWTSADGLTWQQQLDQAFAYVDPTDVVAIGNDIYVLGYYTSCSELDEECTDDESSGTVLFKSSNGGPWLQLAQTTDILHAEFDGLDVWNNSLVAWGAAADDDVTTTLWTSKDGLNWAPTSNLAGIDPIDSIGVGGPGLIAFGTSYDDEADQTQLMGATSRDGATFEKANTPSVANASVTAMAAGPGGVAGIGYVESDEMAPSAGLTVFSTDGITWTQTMAGSPDFASAQLNDIHASSTEYVAVGSGVGSDEFTDQTGRVWVSADGQTWRTLGDFGGLFSQYGGSALGPSGLVVFTASEQPTDEEETDMTTVIYGWFLPTDSLRP